MGDPVSVTAAWSRTDVTHGLGHACVTSVDGGRLLAASEVVAGEEQFACHFTVRTDCAWRTATARVWLADEAGTRESELAVDDMGQWRVDGRPIPELSGCVDIDVAATPATNTLPIRRLGLTVGESRPVDVVWVQIPSLRVHRMRQHYSRLPPVDGLDRYEYGDPGYGSFLLTVDAEGLVVDYESFARRV